MNDLRLVGNFWRHPKTKLLIRDFGWQAPACFQQFWEFARENNRFDGDLSGYSDELLEVAVDWQGEPGALIGALVRVGYIDGGAGARRIHDWIEHQPYVAETPLRIERARAGGLARAAKHRGQAIAPTPPQPQPIVAATPREPIDDMNTCAELFPCTAYSETQEIVAAPPPLTDYPTHLPPQDTLLVDSGDATRIVVDMYERCRPKTWRGVQTSEMSWVHRNVLRSTSTMHGAIADLTCGQAWQAISALSRDDVSWIQPSFRELRWLLDAKHGGDRLWQAMNGGLAKIDIQRRTDPMKDPNSPEFMEELMRLHSESEARRAAGGSY